MGCRATEKNQPSLVLANGGMRNLWTKWPSGEGWITVRSLCVKVRQKGSPGSSPFGVPGYRSSFPAPHRMM